MNVTFSDFSGDRIKEIEQKLYETNSEYALAAENRRALYEKLEPIIMSEKEVTLTALDFLDLRDFFKNELTVTAITQQLLYKQGYLDCVDLLKILGILK